MGPSEGNEVGPGVSAESPRITARGEIAAAEDASEFRVQGKLDKSVHIAWQAPSNDDDCKAQMCLPIQSHSASPRQTEFERRRYDHKMKASNNGPEVVPAGSGAAFAGAMDFFSGVDRSPTPKHGGATRRGVRRTNRYASQQTPPWIHDAA